MRALWIALLAAFALSWAACATPYEIKMKDGRTIETRNEPEPEKATGFYVFEDQDGKRVRVNKDEIVEIRPK
jgi:hypothetical protein